MLARDSLLSLFPLSVVLFPGMVLPLHIFEERYKAMIRECLATERTFGVVLAKSKRAQSPNVAELGGDDIYNVGTTARITAVENLKDGRMNLVTIGEDRFVIKNTQPSKDDVLLGWVDPLPMEDDDNPQKIKYLIQQLRPIVKRYIGHLGDAAGEDFSDAILPTDPTALAFLAGAALQGPLPNKQMLLATKSLTALMAISINVLDREDKILAYMLRAYQAHRQIQRLPFVDYSLN